MSRPTSLDLLLVNARVITMDPGVPAARAVAVSGDKILSVGGIDQVRSAASGNARVIDCGGRTLLPGFIDAHCHLLATARTFQDLDCRSGRAATIPGLKELVRFRALATPLGDWVRGFGYDDLALAEERHPTRWDLDGAAPDHPVRLDHRSGHATVLNSRALRLAGIDGDTPGPVSGVIDRDQSSGEPTGLLLDMAGYLRARLGNTRDETGLANEVAAASHRLLSYGITSVQDAGAENGMERWATLRQLQESHALRLRVTMFAGPSKIDELVKGGLAWGAGDARLRLGHVKVMLTMSTGDLSPQPEDLDQLVRRAHQAGFPVAIHCVEQEAVAAAAGVLSEHRNDAFGTAVRDRIEHCAECPPDLLDGVLRSGAAVVTQPGFIYWNGPEYRQRVEANLQPHLYPAAALHRAGVPVAFGSDAPVIDSNPWPAIYSAVSGHTRDGRPIAGDGDYKGGTVPVATALRMYTLAAAEADGAAAHKGSITPGKLADMVLVDDDPLTIETEALKHIRPVLTVLGGEVMWEAESPGL